MYSSAAPSNVNTSELLMFYTPYREYPGKRGGSSDDKENFIKLIRDLKKAFRPKQLLLTAAIGAAAPTIDVAYDIPQMYKYLDYVHVMCYDYHGKWDR